VDVIQREVFDQLDAPVLRVTQADVPMPYNKQLERLAKPSPDRVVAAYVDGESRYERGGMDWQELTAAAHSARRAMLAPPGARPVAAPHA